jgi:hypothetical protein
MGPIQIGAIIGILPYVSTRISKIPVLVWALPVLERVPVLEQAYAHFSKGFAFLARLFWWPVPV